jgi:CspA family cold shock protein
MPAAAPASSNRQFGTVKWYNDAQGFGFITSDFGGELILRRQSITEHTQRLKEGMKVSYQAVHLPMLLMAEQVQPEE